MNPARWEAVGELFEQALALPVGERTACIERASDGDSGVGDHPLGVERT